MRVRHAIVCLLSCALTVTSVSAAFAASPTYSRSSSSSYSSSRSTGGTWYDAQARLMQAQASLITAQGNFIRAIAEARASDAKTLNMLEQTRGVALDNNLKACKTYYEKRNVHDTFEALGTTGSPGRETAQVKRPVAAKPTAAVRMQGLAPNEWDATTRRLKWPHALENERYAQARAQLDALFAGRSAADAGVGSPFYTQVRRHVDIMKQLLKAEIRNMSPAEYMAARRFLDHLVVEAVSPSVTRAANVAEAF